MCYVFSNCWRWHQAEVDNDLASFERVFATVASGPRRVEKLVKKAESGGKLTSKEK
jgi:hypothetical protein